MAPPQKSCCLKKQTGELILPGMGKTQLKKNNQWQGDKHRRFYSL